jgi:hypothetical protein
VEPLGVGLRAEQRAAAIGLAIGLQPLEDLLRVVEHHGRRIELQVGARADLRVVPASLVGVSDGHHMIGEVPAPARILQHRLAVLGRNRVRVVLDFESRRRAAGIHLTSPPRRGAALPGAVKCRFYEDSSCYQAGVYQALHEANIEPDWVSGVSIGAINSAIIAGNPPEQRLARMRAFWERITDRRIWAYTPDGDIFRKARNATSAWFTMTQGQPGFFEPRRPGPWFSPTGRATSRT